MKYFWGLIFSLILSINPSYAEDNSSRMVEVENYFGAPLEAVGLLDYPPFSRYVPSKKSEESGVYNLESALLTPTIKALKKYNISVVPQQIYEEDLNTKMMLLDVRSGKYKLFVGAYSNTRLYSGLQLIFPASISNPIHIISTPESISKITSIDDLKNLRGVISKTEQLSDFIARKVDMLGIEYVDTPYEGYEKVILGKVDYMLGSLYYNRMMASHYGVGSFLSYSKKPLFNIPVFIGISKVMPRLSQYMEVFKEVFSQPEFVNAVRQEFLRAVLQEERAYEGTVPPSFVQNDVESEDEKFLELGEGVDIGGDFEDEDKADNPEGRGVEFDYDDEETEDENGAEGEESDQYREEDDLKRFKGHIIEQEVKQKTIDEVLEGI